MFRSISLPPPLCLPLKRAYSHPWIIRGEGGIRHIVIRGNGASWVHTRGIKAKSWTQARCAGDKDPQLCLRRSRVIYRLNIDGPLPPRKRKRRQSPRSKLNAVLVFTRYRTRPSGALIRPRLFSTRPLSSLNLHVSFHPPICAIFCTLLSNLKVLNFSSKCWKQKYFSVLDIFNAENVHTPFQFASAAISNESAIGIR